MPDTSDEKVFPASPRKRKEARKNGQVAKSPELAGALVLLTLVVWIHMQLGSGTVITILLGDFQTAFAFNPHATELNLATASLLFTQSAIWGAKLVLPALLVGMVAGLMVNVAQVGLAFTPQALIPKFERVNIASGLKRMLGTHGIVGVIKGLLKMVLLGWVCYKGIMGGITDILNASQGDLVGMLSVVGQIIWGIGVKVASVLFVIAVGDYIYQRYDYEKNMKMSHSELKQEMKQTDGDPLVKRRIRLKQREIASKRMMQKVPKADVIITNPTHYAVALQYDGATMTAPKVIAKGQDLIAQKIKEIGREHDVPMVENVALARALYAQVQIDQEIPPMLFQAVAEILSFVYRTNAKTGKRTSTLSNTR